MPIDYEEAMQLALTKESESNLARCYVKLMNLLVEVTHHPGALAEMDNWWKPIVRAELRRRAHGWTVKAPAGVGSSTAVRDEQLLELARVDGVDVRAMSDSDPDGCTSSCELYETTTDTEAA